MTIERKTQLQVQLTEIAADLSGYDVEELSPTQTFLGLGFDSLFLTQLASVYQKEFGEKITFRQLINDQPSIDALSTWLDSILPLEAGPSPIVEAPAAPIAEDATLPLDRPQASQQSASPITSQLPVAPRSTIPEGLAGILAEQVSLMRQQLDMLQAARAGAAPTASIAESASPAPQAKEQPKAVAAPASAAESVQSDAQPTPSVPAGFGPNVSDEAGETLTSEQQVHLDRLIARYTARTTGSKSATQRDRFVHADPRTAAGFNPLWKEMVYPIVVKKSLGAYLWDIDDNQYIDILNGFGPNFFGHRAPFIVNALREQLDEGYEVGPQTPRAGDAARLLCELTGMDRVSWVNTGSEAVQAAIRISRTVTGRDKIVVFKGDYHGNFDEVLVRGVGAGEKARTMPLAPGIPFKSVENVIVVEYGEAGALETIRANADEIAAVLVEPVQSRRPEFQPREFLHELRALTLEKEIVLVFDEVITGFRICPGGAQEYFGIETDLTTYGKIIGGGMPIGVVAGRSKYMDTFDGGHWDYGDASKPTAGVTFFAGTFVRHPMAIAAAHASLEYLKAAGPELQQRVNAMTTRLATSLNALFEERCVNMHVAHFASQMFIRVQEESELATLFFYHLRARGIHVLENFPSYVTAAHTDKDIDTIIDAARDAICDMQADGVLSSSLENAKTEEWTRSFPLTEPQRAMWFTSQMGEMASCAFNESDSLVIEGPLQEDKFNEAIVLTLKRHEAFSLRFDEDGVNQRVDRNASFEVETVDLRGKAKSEADSALDSLLSECAKTPFDLMNGPIVRAVLVRTGDDRRVFSLFCHHIVFDGYSASLVIKEIAERYRAAIEGSEPELESASQFSVYAYHTTRRDSDEAYKRALEYWKGVFANGAPDLLELPIDYPRPNDVDVRGATIHRALKPEILDEAKATARKAGVSLNSLLFSTYAILLGKLASREDFVIGVPASGQSATDIDAVGYCVNVLPIRTKPNLERSFASFAKHNQKVLIDALEHQELSFSALVREVGAPREENRLPLTETVFNYSRYFADIMLPGCEATVRENKRVAVYYDLFFNIIETDRQLDIYWDYSSSLFSAETINRWIDAYIETLNDICENPECLVGDAGVSSARVSIAENYLTVKHANDEVQLGYDAFERQAAQSPEKIAVVCDGREYSYGEIKSRSDQIAAALINKGAREGAFIGILLQRSADLIVAVLGVWKAGCAYLPLDPEYPAGRLRYMTEDAGARFIIAENNEHVLHELPLETIAIDDAIDGVSAASQSTLPVRVSADAPAYIIYTSGSTGKPKGVVNSHSAMVNFLTSMAKAPGISVDDCLLAVTTLSFDISILELFLPVSIGATVVVAMNDEAIDGFALADLIKEHQVTMMQSTPATWRLLLDSDPEALNGLKALCGGEALTRALTESLLSYAGELWNMYGPTETTVWSSCTKITRADEITVGDPIDNTSIYVVDRLGRPVLPGVIGEVWIGGRGVAQGYHGKLELTQEKFHCGSSRQV